MSILAVEIGGTKLQAAIGRPDGTIIHHRRVPARADLGADGIRGQILELVEQLRHQAGDAGSIGSACLGFGGPVDTAAGRVLTSHQVGGWSGFPLAAWFAERTGLPRVTVGNDSDLAGLAEATLGAGRGRSPVVYSNIGSGIGGAIIVDGRLFPGQGIGAAEIGHLRVRPRPSPNENPPGSTFDFTAPSSARVEEPHAPHGGAREAITSGIIAPSSARVEEPHAPHGAAGEAMAASAEPWATVEDLCSGWGLARRFGAVRPASVEPSDPHSTRPFFQALSEGDAAAKAIWADAVQVYAVALANVTALLHPAVIVVGGGVANVGDVLFEPLRREFDRQVFGPFRGTTEILPAALGDDVVLVGALLAAEPGTLPEKRRR